MSNGRRVFAILVAALVAAYVVPSSATLLLYDPFDYTAGERLGGSGTSPLGQTAPNGQQWITRSPASGGTYDPTRDTLITAGNLYYPGLASSLGNSVRYGSSAGPTDKYTDAIALPSAIASGSLYYSMIVNFHGVIPTGGGRTSYAALSTDTADPLSDAGFGVGTASGTGNIPMPAGAWIRNAGANYQLGGGKMNSDGLGTSASAPSWQHATLVYPNQQGNISGAGQDYAGIADDTYFIVMKYTFNGSSAEDDTVSMWVNPAAQTLGYNGGEAEAGVGGTYGSYYSSINANVSTLGIDASQIQSFMLIGLAQSSASTTKSIDTSLDELRIGTTWADVTPVPEPGVLTLLGLGLTGLLCLRRRV